MPKPTFFPRGQFTSFEDASLLRKFTILYFFMSILPVGLLYVIYMQIDEFGNVVIEQYDFFVLLMGVVILVGIGYVGMRSIFGRIVGIAWAERQTIEKLLGPGKAASAGSSKNELAVLTESFREITSHLEENVRSLELAKKTLHSVLSKVGEGLSSQENINSFLNLIIETITDAFMAHTGALLTLDEKKKEVRVQAVMGHKSAKIKKIGGQPVNELIEQYMKSRQPVVVPEGADENPFAKLFGLPLLISPLILHDKALGMIVISGRDLGATFSEEEQSLLFNLSLQTAVAMENARLNEDAEKTYFETVSALAMAVEAKDPYSRGHSERVAQFAIEIAEEMSLGPDEITLLRDAAKLHDLGKIGILDEVLRKNGPLNAQETEVMQKHPEIGEGIIKPVRSLRPLCDIIRHHHEKLDGSGYPDGLHGSEIDLLVRILTVADIYDALTTNRPYREPYLKEKAISTLYSMKEQLDVKIIQAFERALVKQPSAPQT